MTQNLHESSLEVKDLLDKTLFKKMFRVNLTAEDNFDFEWIKRSFRHFMIDETSFLLVNEF